MYQNTPKNILLQNMKLKMYLIIQNSKKTIFPKNNNSFKNIEILINYILYIIFILLKLKYWSLKPIVDFTTTYLIQTKVTKNIWCTRFLKIC